MSASPTEDRAEDPAGGTMFRMFASESRSFKTAMLVILAAHCPAVIRAGSDAQPNAASEREPPVSVPYRSWSYKLLKCAQLSLGIDAHFIDAYWQLIPDRRAAPSNPNLSTSAASTNEFKAICQANGLHSMISPFLEVVKTRITNPNELILEILLFLLAFSFLPADSKAEVIM